MSEIQERQQLTGELKDGLDSVRSVVKTLVEEKVCITVSSMCDVFAEYLYGLAVASSSSATALLKTMKLSQDDFIDGVRWVVSKRIEQVGCLKGRAEFKYVEYPMCLFPLLEAFGRVEDHAGGLVIFPEQLDAGEPPARYDAMLNFLRMHRIPVTKGLPVVVKADSDLFFRLTVQDGEILVASDGSNIDPTIVLARCFFTMPLLQLFGVPRYSLGPVAIQKSAFNLVARLGYRD